MTAPKKNFGLPSLGTGSVAASLIKKPQIVEDNPSASQVDVNDGEEEKRPSESLGSMGLLATKPTPEGSPFSPVAVTAAPSLEPARAGRPKGPPSKRFHISMELDIATYLNRAWRTHERPNGELAAGPSDLLEDLLIEHRRRHPRS